ncbi:Cellulosome-anchoring protein precursor [Sporotomaculum syntrophicum]|uniref:Cellulosome-anchoring protein n=1 Tax=Sporotomaculum syntrophicum TaxID=182264 RepID=A0A9D2WS14_9FIRM|nr:S-layer homology domain-containing protein [Sporotomaculum syntrophicum]KAF1086043.1 Cellulosome-anchoring protein precursor [Sporotomaculum syntrophicum]
MTAGKCASLRIVIALALVFSMCLASAAFAEPAAPTIPAFPAIYDGTVKAADGTAIVSGTVKAYINNEVKGEVAIKSGAYQDLIVTGEQDQIVTFKVVVNGNEYTAISDPAQVKFAIGAVSGDNFPMVNLTVNLTGASQVSLSAPTASPVPGKYSAGVKVSFKSATTGAKIYYTTDDTSPVDSQSKKEYTAPIAVTSTTIFKAVAEKDNLYSAVKTFAYSIGAGGAPSSGGNNQDASTEPEEPGSTNEDTNQEPPADNNIDVSFTDLNGHWAEATIKALAGKQIITGYPDNTFMPGKNITRAECAVILARALNLNAESETVLDTFSDQAGIPQWSRQALAAAVNDGLLKGYPAPGGGVAVNAQNNITRQELAVIMSRILNQKLGVQEKAELTFADNSAIAAWASEDIAIAVANGIVKGYSDNTFKPGNNVTRAEVAAMVSRLLDLLE